MSKLKTGTNPAVPAALAEALRQDAPERASADSASVLLRRIDSQLSLRKIEVFCRVAELQSVSQAAQQLFISQPVVTAHLRSLEEKLGTPLLYREGRGIALTQAGLRVFRWARETIVRTRELERDLAGMGNADVGSAVVASSMSIGSYLLPPMVCDFQLQHPEGLVEVIISNPQAAMDVVRSGEADFAVLLVSPDQDTSGLVAYPLWDEPLLLMSAPDSLWVGDTVDREQMSRLPFISTSNSTVMYRLEEGQLRANGVASRRTVLYLGHPEAQKEAVRRDVGVCFFTRSAVQEDLRRGDMRWVKALDCHLSLPVYMLYREDKDFSRFQLSLRAFLEAARPAGLAPFRRADE